MCNDPLPVFFFFSPETHFDYVLSAIMDASASEPTAPPTRNPDSNTAPRKLNPSSRGREPSAEGTGKAVGDRDGIMQSLISQVKDLLPHLGEGFIEV